MTMRYPRDYRGGGTIRFGDERPDRLFDIVDVTYERDRKTWSGFTFRCGQALAHFLDPDGLRWLGRYSSELLKLNAKREHLTKKVGTYWMLIGAINVQRGQYPRVTPASILSFCGIAPNHTRPNRTVDALVGSHLRLREMGIFDEAPDFEPGSRERGYFDAWLSEPREGRLSSRIFPAIEDAGRRQATNKSKRRQKRQPIPTGENDTSSVVPSADEIRRQPVLICKFRRLFNVRQVELAKRLGISRRALSRYENKHRQPNKSTAERMAEIWRRQVDGRASIA